jgi:hypothetical protein
MNVSLAFAPDENRDFDLVTAGEYIPNPLGAK